MYVAVDLGATKTRLGSSRDLKTLNKSAKFLTERILDLEVLRMEQSLEEILEGLPLQGICLGVPGVLDRNVGKYRKLPNYPVLNGKPFDALLPSKYKSCKKILVANDAALAGYAEALTGAGRNYGNVLYITIGTGLGGTFVRNRSSQCLQEVFEPGHSVFFEDGKSFEEHSSGRAFGEIYKMSSESAPPQVWESYARDLAYGLDQVLKVCNPDVIVFGGGFTFHNYVRFYEHLERFLSKNVRLRPAEHGDESGIYGGFYYLSSVLE